MTPNLEACNSREEIEAWLMSTPSPKATSRRYEYPSNVTIAIAHAYKLGQQHARNDAPLRGALPKMPMDLPQHLWAPTLQQIKERILSSHITNKGYPDEHAQFDDEFLTGLIQALATAPEATGVGEGWRSVESDPPPHDVPVILLTPKIPGVVTREKDEIEVRPFSHGGWLQPDGTVRGRSYHGYAEYWLPLDILPKPALAAQPTATGGGE